MIRFTLNCDNGHEFESWFASNESYEFQARTDLVACPHCNSVKVSKGVMAPAVARKDRAAPPKQDVVLMGDKDAELRRMVRELHAKIVQGTDDVGSEFPTEARRIHDGEAPERAIRGQASMEEARALIDEGVSVLPVPILPDERG